MDKCSLRKIVFVTSYPLGAEPVVKNRLTPYIESAFERGYFVTLVSPDKNDFTLLTGERFIHVKVAPFSVQKTNFLLRAYSESLMAMRLLKSAYHADGDAIVITIPSMFLLFFNFTLKKKQTFLDLRDLTWEYLSERNGLTRLAKLVFRFLAKRSIKRCNFIAVTNDTEFEYLFTKFYVSRQKLIQVPNGVSKKQFNRLACSVCENPEDKVVVSYVGNVGLAQNLTTLIDVAIEMPNVVFNIVGAGNDFDRILKYKTDNHAENVYMLGRVDWELIPTLYKKSHILYAQLTDEFSGAMPSKLYEYLCTGKYVLYAGGSQAKETLGKFDNNMVLAPENSRELFEKLNFLIKSGEHRNISYDNRKKVQEFFIREDSVANFYEKIEGQS